MSRARKGDAMSKLPEQHDGDRYTALAAKVEYPEAWKPKEGDILVGEAIGWETVAIDRDGEERACEVLRLRIQDGTEHSVWCWHAVLRRELIGKVEPGDFVALHHNGPRKKQSGDGDYAAYRVAIDKLPESDIRADRSDLLSQGKLPDNF
jgi:hypothetical protein